MIIQEKNVAYDLDMLELENQKAKSNVVDIPKDKLDKIRTRKFSPIRVFMSFIMVCFVTACIVTIVSGNAKLTELNQKISVATQDLENQESAYTQIDMKLESKYSPNYIEQYAQDSMGMKKTDQYQIDYIKFSQGDKAEIVQEESQNIFESIAKAIEQIWE